MLHAMKRFKITKKNFKNKHIYKIPLSRNTIKRRVKAISTNLEEQMLADLRASPVGHAFQSDSSTDVDHKEQLVAFVSFEANGKNRREMLFLKEIELHANAQTTTHTIDDYYEENDLDHNDRHDNTSDGCATMMGSRTGVLTQSNKKKLVILQKI